MAVLAETRFGRVEGASSSDIESYLGIPYARPPVGELRFRPPRPPEPWSHVRPALEFGAVAPQRPPTIPTLLPKAKQATSEDCLTLNVWTPRAGPGRRPVLVWVHGGGLLNGAAADPIYYGDSLARRGDVVVVTFGYRLGVLGFLHHPALLDPTTRACGNWGILDQMAALQWVRDNIAHFGGDPENITIVGGSAGATSTVALAASPTRRRGFRRAIVQSARFSTTPVPRAVAASQALLEACGLASGDVAKLRELPLERVLELQAAWAERLGGFFGILPVGDGVSVAPDPIAAARRSVTSGIDLLIGTNRDEYKLLGTVDGRRTTLDLPSLRQRLEPLPAEQIELAISTYRTARTARGEASDPWELWCAIQTDQHFRTPALRFADDHSASGSVTYAYLFGWDSPFSDGTLGACHGLERPFVFGTHALVPEFAGASREAYELVGQMQDAWLTFARMGNPTHPGIPAWPRYDAPRRAHLVLDDPCRRENAPREPERAFWERLTWRE